MAKERDRAWRRQNEAKHKPKRYIEMTGKAHETTMVEVSEYLEKLSSSKTELEEYQEWVRSITRDEMQERYGLIYGGIKLAAEAGEVANIVGKAMHGDINRVGNDYFDRLVDELGDVLWYIAYMCNSLDCSIDDLIVHNINKLTKRYPDAGTKQG